MGRRTLHRLGHRRLWSGLTPDEALPSVVSLVIDGAAIALAALSSLVREGELDAKVYAKAEKNFAVSTDRDDIASL